MNIIFRGRVRLRHSAEPHRVRAEEHGPISLLPKSRAATCDERSSAPVAAGVLTVRLAAQVLATWAATGRLVLILVCMVMLPVLAARLLPPELVRALSVLMTR
jgi:hypothetical protein